MLLCNQNIFADYKVCRKQDMDELKVDEAVEDLGAMVTSDDLDATVTLTPSPSASSTSAVPPPTTKAGLLKRVITSAAKAYTDTISTANAKIFQQYNCKEVSFLFPQGAVSITFHSGNRIMTLSNYVLGEAPNPKGKYIGPPSCCYNCDQS